MLQQTTAFYSTYFEYIFTSLKIKAGREKMDWDREERERESERDFAKYLVTDSKGRKILFTCFSKHHLFNLFEIPTSSTLLPPSQLTIENDYELS